MNKQLPSEVWGSAREAMRKMPLEEQSEIYEFATEIGGKVDGLDARDGMEVILKLGQYLAKHPEGIRDDPN